MMSDMVWHRNVANGVNVIFDGGDVWRSCIPTCRVVQQRKRGADALAYWNERYLSGRLAVRNVHTVIVMNGHALWEAQAAVYKGPGSFFVMWAEPSETVDVVCEVHASIQFVVCD